MMFAYIGSVSTTRIGFGTSRLHYLNRSIERQDILAAAYDAGIRHFDTAPVYGHGLAEREVGKFVRGRQNCVVVSKHGIDATPWIGALPNSLLKPALLARSLGNKAFGQGGAIAITPNGLRLAVEASLRRIGRDMIDIHVLHEPDPAMIADFDGVVAMYERLIADGKIRVAGISGDFRIATKLLERAPGFILQTDEREWTDLRAPDVTYGAISRQAQSRSQASLSTLDAKARLSAALARRPNGVVLVSTRTPTNLRALVD